MCCGNTCVEQFFPTARHLNSARSEWFQLRLLSSALPSQLDLLHLIPPAVSGCFFVLFWFGFFLRLI